MISIPMSSQRDARWRDIRLSRQNPRLTWGQWGCLAHCLLYHAVATGVIERADPHEWIETLHRNRVIDRESGMMPLRGLWATRFAPFSNRVESVVIGYQGQETARKVRDYLARGIPVFAMVDHNPATPRVEQHWVMIVDAADASPRNWLIADPWHGQTGPLSRWYRAFVEFVFVDKIDHKPYRLGVDLSQWQTFREYNWHGVHYAYIRATEGVRHDTEYANHARSLHENRVPFSAYHFLRPRSRFPIETQVARFLSRIASAPRPTHRAIVDYETMAPAPDAEDLRLFIEEFERREGAHTLAIYSRANILAGVPRDVIGDRPIIQAHYSRVRDPLPYGLQPAIWQFSPSGRMAGWPGGDGNIDWNYLLDLEAMERGPRVVAPPVRPPAPAPAPMIDLLPYVRPIGDRNGQPYMMQMSDGRQERYQYQPCASDPQAWYITKNSQWEYYRLDAGGMVRNVTDTSPEPHEGRPAYYRVVAADGTRGGLYHPRFMRVGETFVEPQAHKVTFFDKNSGHDYGDPRSGHAQNQTTLVSCDEWYAVLRGSNGEVHTYERGRGRIRWESPWGEAGVAPDDAGSFDNVREAIR